MEKVISLMDYKKAKKAEKWKNGMQSFTDIIFSKEFLIPTTFFAFIVVFFFSLGKLTDFIF